MDTADWLHQQLNQNGLKQADIAQAVGVTDKSVSNWVHGVHSPSKENLKKLKSFFAQHTERAGIIYPPFSSRGCSRCRYQRRCKRRLRYGYPVMCEGLTTKDLRLAEAYGCLNDFVWWKECQSLSDLT